MEVTRGRDTAERGGRAEDLWGPQKQGADLRAECLVPLEGRKRTGSAFYSQPGRKPEFGS